jgi:hypothetical protein
MHPLLAQKQSKSLLEDRATYRKLELNKQKNQAQDHTSLIDAAAGHFSYTECADSYWNPESFSLLWGTPLWEGATPTQRRILNQLYWVAYYSQIISAEIATIFLNQVSAAGLYTLEDFRLVCDNLDLETQQERAHINAFKKVGEEVEATLFGERLFTYPMRSLYGQTMIFAAANRAQTFWRKLQLQAFTLLSSQNAFLASQYLLIRGLRTLNGKLIQHPLSIYYQRHPEQERIPVPSAISHYHFLDESFHFNTSRLIGHEVPRSLAPPTAFEKWLVNRGVAGCQQDHFHFSVAVRGIFWYDPALFNTIYKLLRSAVFGLPHDEAMEMLCRCFCRESEGLMEAAKMHEMAVASYRTYVEPIAYLQPDNREMRFMARNNIQSYLRRNQKALARFQPS